MGSNGNNVEVANQLANALQQFRDKATTWFETDKFKNALNNVANQKYAESVGPTGKNAGEIESYSSQDDDSINSKQELIPSDIEAYASIMSGSPYAPATIDDSAIENQNKANKAKRDAVTDITASWDAAVNQPERDVIHMPDVGDYGYIIPGSDGYYTQKEKVGKQNTDYTGSANGQKDAILTQAINGSSEALKAVEEKAPDVYESITARNQEDRSEDGDYKKYFDSLSEDEKRGVSATLGEALLFDDFDTLSKWMTSDLGRYWYEDEETPGSDDDLYGNAEARRAWYDAGKANNIIDPYGEHSTFDNPELIGLIWDISGGDIRTAISIYEALTNYDIAAAEKAGIGSSALQPYANWYKQIKYDDSLEDRDDRANAYAGETYLSQIAEIDDPRYNNIKTSDINHIMRHQGLLYGPMDTPVNEGSQLTYNTSSYGGNYDSISSDENTKKSLELDNMYNTHEAFDKWRAADKYAPDKIAHRWGLGNIKAS